MTPKFSARAIALLLTLCTCGPSAAFDVGAGDWTCAAEATTTDGQTLAECLSHLVVLTAISRRKPASIHPADLFDPKPTLTLQHIAPRRHHDAELLQAPPASGAAMPRVRLVLLALQASLAHLARDPNTRRDAAPFRAALLTGDPPAPLRGAGATAVICHARGPAGALQGFGPSPVECLADLLLLACPPTVLDEVRCAGEASLDALDFVAPGDPAFAAALTRFAGPAIAADLPAPPERPNPWLLPQMSHIRSQALRRARDLTHHFAAPLSLSAPDPPPAPAPRAETRHEPPTDSAADRQAP